MTSQSVLHFSTTLYLSNSTDHQPQYVRATQCSFLRLAGQGCMSLPILSQWLSQDRLYAQAYVRFIGGLISRLRLPILPPGGGVEGPGGKGGKRVDDGGSNLDFRILQVLNAALTGIVRELSFFEQTAGKYGIDLATTEKTGWKGTASSNVGGRKGEFGPDDPTQAYINLFDSFTVGSTLAPSLQEPENRDGDFERTLFSGLVLLWATEKVYLDAWSYAASQSPPTEGHKDLDGGALRKEFIPNWTSPEFRNFVGDIGRVLDEVAIREGKESGQSAARDLAEMVWKRVLELEVGFWPNVEG